MTTVPTVPTIALSDGHAMPQLGFGLWRVPNQDAPTVVAKALQVGYRSMDSAQAYENEQGLGQAIAASSIPRDALFITTKLWNEDQGFDAALRAFDASLARLGLEYVDLYLIHWPSPGGAVPVAEYMTALAEAKARGLAREIGVSNFTLALMQQAIDVVGAGEIATNQVELHPYLQNRKVAGFAERHGIRITSYMTLGYGKVLGDAVIGEIAQRHGATPAQVVLAWAMQLGYAVIPSSTKRANLASNLAARELLLSDADMAAIAALERNERITSPASLAPAWD